MPDRQKWHPSYFTPSLTGTEDFITDGDKLLEFVDLAYCTPELGFEVELDDWQRWLIRHLLERYPDDWPDPAKAGRLRYRTVLISMGRQNGKSLLASVLALYGLLFHTQGPEVVGVASTVEQANIVYKRVCHVLNNNPALLKRFTTSGTRGIKSRTANPATYFVKTGKEDALQGVTISLCVADELHLWKDATYNAVLFGTSARRDGLIVGITTAGDENSELLKRLYKVAHEGEDDSMGHFIWEAPEHLGPGDPEALIAANPAIACGRVSLDQELNALKSMPEHQARRYRLNQFVSTEGTWLPMALWTGAEKGTIPDGVPYVLAVDRSENWNYATITACAKHNGKLYTEVVASLVNPNLDQLEAMLIELSRRRKPSKIFMEASVLRELAMSLRERGLPVEYLTTAQVMNACSLVYSLLSEGSVIHADDPVVNKQMPRAVAKSSGDGWRITRRNSVGEVDAVLATVFGLYGMSITKPASPALHIG